MLVKLILRLLLVVEEHPVLVISTATLDMLVSGPEGRKIGGLFGVSEVIKRQSSQK